MRRVVLSKRLQMLADMVTMGSRVADVGCDHGFLSIWLVQAGVSPGVLAMDVRKGPLAAAREHIEAYGLGDYIETRLSDGLKNCDADEAETLVCAGMGGRLMERILTESMGKVRGLRELVLQPQSELREFRAFLRREGFTVLQEEAVCEDGKFYFAMKAVPGGVNDKDDKEAHAAFQSGDSALQREIRVCDRFGERLISAKNPVLRQYLLWRRKGLARLADTLRFADVPKAEGVLGAADNLEAEDAALGAAGALEAEDAVLGAADTLEAEDAALGAVGALETEGALKGCKAGSERQQARLQEVLMELSDVEYALKRMQQESG